MAICFENPYLDLISLGKVTEIWSLVPETWNLILAQFILFTVYSYLTIPTIQIPSIFGRKIPKQTNHIL